LARVKKTQIFNKKKTDLVKKNNSGNNTYIKLKWYSIFPCFAFATQHFSTSATSSKLRLLQGTSILQLSHFLAGF